MTPAPKSPATPDSPPRRKRMPRAERERQMIRIAEATFAERGYTAASMDDIAEQVGVSKPMLYEYFGSKEGLLLACIAQSRTELRAATEEAVTGAADAEQALRRGLHAFFVYIKEHRQGWSLLRHEVALVGTAAADAIEATRRQQTDLIIALMGGFYDFGAADGDIGELRVQAIAELVVGSTERLAIWCERNESVTPEQATGFAMDLIWGGLARHARTPDQG